MGTHPIFESDFDCLTEKKMGNPNEHGASAPPLPDCPPPAYEHINAPGPSMAPTVNPPLAGFTPAPAGFQPGQPQQPYAPGATAPIITAPGAAPPVMLPTTGAPHMVQGQTVIIQQPRFGTQPVLCQCPYCQQQVLTKVEHESGLGTWLICGGMCLFGLSLGCCLIPFCINDLKDARHKCPNCKRTIRVKKFIS